MRSCSINIGKLGVVWSMERVSKPFRTPAFHRTLAEYFQALCTGGLLVSRLVEPRPTLEAVGRYLLLSKLRRIPHSLVIEAVKAMSIHAQ